MEDLEEEVQRLVLLLQQVQEILLPLPPLKEMMGAQEAQVGVAVAVRDKQATQTEIAEAAMDLVLLLLEQR
jgi:hypothetical protein